MRTKLPDSTAPKNAGGEPASPGLAGRGLAGMEIVVARYREDVSWTAALAAAGAAVTVYDKGGDNGGSAAAGGAAGPARIPLPNTGREAHTYLHHILARWPDFPEYTVFCQGWPFDHMGGRTTDASTGRAPAGLGREMADLLAGLAARRVKFKGLADYAVRCDRAGRPHHLFDPEGRGKWAGHGRDIPLGEAYGLLFSGEVPETFHCRAPAGLLLVSRERILLRPRGLYETAMAMVQADPDDARNTGHALERLWYIVFNGYAALSRDGYTAEKAAAARGLGRDPARSAGAREG
ncbi:DUF3431 domain-containing protein [Desulfovibrio sp. X2]|uniref:DUF3431 domain-containing protein n=1 Tax=Desulfovibrio sp. X2 TaxID=941449 RepID=UPI001F31050D|nr:DUF3431 domain-containing protein [Desulfovibrio sp. X2]